MVQVKSPKTGMIEYDLTVGLSAMDGRGFYYPSDTAIGRDGRFYVVNRSLESVNQGVRVTMCDIQSEFYGIFGKFGEDDGSSSGRAAPPSTARAASISRTSTWTAFRSSTRRASSCTNGAIAARETESWMGCRA